VLAKHEVERDGFVLVTLHRPALVDDPELLVPTMEVLAEVAERIPVLFPVHPRTRARLDASGSPGGSVRLLEPMDYLEFIALEAEARLVITDSGGVQEETSVLGVPCLTYRTTTERPITIELGTNRLIGVDPGALAEAAREALEADPPSEPPRIPAWDGRAGPRAAEAVVSFLRS
jgi:UDP-N-acetylglucosamine 2-epimerase (non-hydrolysing)